MENVEIQSLGNSNEHLLKLHIATVVPFLIYDLALQGGPSDLDIARLRKDYVDIIASKGDCILYRVKGETAKAVTVLCESLAILAFCPGGITFLGMHFEAHATHARA
jgi:hypothetical protein